MKATRVKYVEISAQILADIFKRAVKNKFPKDAEVLRVKYDALNNNYQAVIYSKKFDKVPEGALIPRLEDPILSSDVLK